MNYRKLRKLLVSPRLFLVDALNNKIKAQGEPKINNGKKGATKSTPAKVTAMKDCEPSPPPAVVMAEIPG
ncbi:MAG: hypothetical protein ACRCRW_09195, partial [Aeromonadaceae bacterium]